MNINRAKLNKRFSAESEEQKPSPPEDEKLKILLKKAFKSENVPESLRQTIRQMLRQ